MNLSKSLKRDWYLVFCKPRQELTAKLNLERQGYQVYLPMIRGIKRCNGKKVARIEPMFPRYLFIQLAQGIDSWGPIRSTLGVAHLVKFGMEPAKVPDLIISNLHSIADDEGYFQLPERRLNPGDKLRITEGVMAGYEGIMVARTGKERVRLLLSSISSAIINIDEEFLESVV